MAQTYDLIGQRQIRIDKANELRKLGIDPYPSVSNRDTKACEIIDDFKKFENIQVIVAGRLMSWREHGSLIFGNIQDQSGSIQLYIKNDVIEKTDQSKGIIGFEELQFLDLGDIVEAKGTVTKTQKGEISVLVEQFKLLTKSIRPLPDKWKGLQDKEKIFRQRYLDLIMNPEHKWRFTKLAEVTYAVREFLNSKGFLEIKTPIIQPLYGGTNAKPFETKVNALNSDFYLAISHELYLKRLITAGFENVFNITGYFRNEGIDRTHNPEFQMIETMTAFKNYEYNMDLIEEMYRFIATKVFGKTNFIVQGHEVDFGKDWPRIKMIDAVKIYAGIDFNNVKSIEEAHKILEDIGVHERPNSIGESMVLVFEEKVEEKLIEPTFIYGHPVEISPLAKSMPEDPRFVERFEIFIGGIEGGDNWTELNDPVELYNRFKLQIDRKAEGDEEAHPMDLEFLEAIEYGMPPTTGLGPGIERLTMMFTETEYIDDILFFPMMKPASVTNTQRKLYGEKYTQGVKRSLKQDKTKKMAVILDKDLTGWKMTNTIGHLSAYLGNKISRDKFQSVPSFTTTDGAINSNSQFPIVTLQAKQAQLHTLLDELEKSGFEFLTYVEEMVEYHDDVELSEALSKKGKEELNILGIGIFGDKEKLEKITKKYSLFK
jgi:lysyl-tRNA synthetase class 2